MKNQTKNQMTDKITDQIIENKVNLEDPFPYVTDRKPLEKAEIIYRTTWKSYPIYIKSVMGLYPTAYIDVKCSDIVENYDCASFRLKHKKFEKNAPFEITYADKHLAISNKMGCQGETLKGNFIGWDYAHCFDYNAMMPDWAGKKHTIAEIVKDATDFIDNNLIPTVEEIHDERNSNRIAKKASRG